MRLNNYLQKASSKSLHCSWCHYKSAKVHPSGRVSHRWDEEIAYPTGHSDRNVNYILFISFGFNYNSH